MTNPKEASVSGDSPIELFFGSFAVTLEYLVVILGCLTAIACCAAAGWVFSWSISKLWDAGRRALAEREDGE